MQKEIRIGLFAFVALALIFWGYKYLLGQNLLKQSQTYSIVYSDVDGLEVSNPVSFRGLKIGTVQKIQPDAGYQKMIVDILIENSGFQPPENTIAELSGTVMGSKSIDLVCDGPCSGTTLENGSEIPGKELGLIGSMVSKQEVNEYLQTVQKGIGGVIDSLGSALSGENEDSEFATMLRDIQASASYLKNVTFYLNSILASSSEQLAGTFENLNSVTENLAANNAQINTILNNFESISEKLNNSPIDTAIGNANNAVVDLQKTIRQAQTSFETLDQFLNQAKSDDGTIGALLNNRELYETLVETNRQLQLIMQDVRLNPKRYINVSVFGKKQKDYEVPEEDPAINSSTSDPNQSQDPE